MATPAPTVSLTGAAQSIGADIARALEADGRALVIWSGGRTPKSIIPALSDLDLDWSGVTFLMGDERWVALDDELSNEGAMRAYLAGTPLEKAAIAGLYRPGLTREAALSDLNRDIARLLETPACAALLGMGPDGHTASLFPGGDWLDLPATQMAAPGQGPADSAPERISLTPAALSRCAHVYLLCNSEEKQAIWARAASGAEPAELPVAILARPGAPRLTLVA